MKKILITFIISFLIGTLFGVFLGVSLTQDNKKKVIETTTVLERIEGRSFLVARSVIVNQKVSINIDQGSSWSNFWWGHEIIASGLIQVDLGVDLSKLDEENILVNQTTKTIELDLPEAEIYSSNLQGNINVETKSGILKRILKNDKDEDYNLALDELSQQSEDDVKENTKLFEKCRIQQSIHYKLYFKILDIL